MSGRVFLYVQNLLGLGHLRRAALIARALAADGLEVAFVSGGMPQPGIDLGGARLIQLPPARVADERFSPILDAEGRPIDDAWRDRRRQTLLDAFAVIRPDLLLIELFPFGRRAFRFELLPLLETARARRSRPHILSSVRDILVDKGRPERTEEVVATIDRFFDRVLVHGDPKLAPLERSFPAASRIADRLDYTGYIVETVAPSTPSRREGVGEVLVTAGGGAVAAPLIEAAIAARSLGSAAERPWRIVAGPGYPEDRWRRLLADAPPGIMLERFRPDLPALYSRCALSISQAGYNTVAEVLMAGARAVLVPFGRGGESEQPLRARLLAERSLATVVAEEDLTPATLAEAVDRALALPPPVAAGRGLDLDGSSRTAALIRKMLVAAP